MAYYNGFPATYTPYYTPVAPVQQPAPPVQATVQGGMIWVSGEAGAKSYLVAPNNSVVLFDSEGQTIYIKSADATGMPSIKVLDYTVRETAKNGANSPVNTNVGNSPEYATKDDLRALSDRIDALKAKMKGMTADDE